MLYNETNKIIQYIIMTLIVTYKAITPDIQTDDGQFRTQIADVKFVQLLAHAKLKKINLQFENSNLFISYKVVKEFFKSQEAIIDFILWASNLHQQSVVLSVDTPLEITKILKAHSSKIQTLVDIAKVFLYASIENKKDRRRALRLQKENKENDA